jgi:hypothetical protein
MSEQPHLKAYLCDECWNTIPHFVVQKQQVKVKKSKDINWKTIVLYTIGNLLCLATIGYYLWLR